MSDDQLIASHIRYAQARQQEISDACARMIASQYHDGQASDSYAFTSTGAISDPDTVWRDLFYLRTGDAMYFHMNTQEQAKADMLGTYLIHAGPRGPVDGWASLWLRAGDGY